MKVLRVLVLILSLLMSGCQTAGRYKVPRSEDISALRDRTPHKIQIESYDPKKIRQLMNRLQSKLSSGQPFGVKDWKVHDELLDVYISLKHLTGSNQILVPAKSQLRLEAASFCLNPRVAIPEEDDPYFLAKAKEVPYQEKLLDYVSNKSSQQELVQELIWNLKNRVQWENYSDEHREILKALDPMAPVNLPSELKSTLKGFAEDIVLDQLGVPDVRQRLEGQFYHYKDYLDQLRELRSQLKKPENRPYKYEGTSVYSISESDGFERHSLTVFNPSEAAEKVDLSQLSLIPVRRDVQPLAIFPSMRRDKKLFGDLEDLLFTQMLRAGIGVTPVLGDLVDIYEVASGTDVFTNESLSTEERYLTILGLLAGSGKYYRMVKKGMSAPGSYVKGVSKRFKTFQDPKHHAKFEEFTKLVDGKLPDSWGATPSKVRVDSVARSPKPQGIVYKHPSNKNDSVRFMPGEPSSVFKNQKEPYVIVQKDGRFFDKNGKVLKGNKGEEAHIPLDEFDFRKFWGKGDE